MPYVVQAYEPSGGDAMSKTPATRKDALPWPSLGQRRGAASETWAMVESTRRTSWPWGSSTRILIRQPGGISRDNRIFVLDRQEQPHFNRRWLEKGVLAHDTFAFSKTTRCRLLVISHVGACGR